MEYESAWPPLRRDLVSMRRSAAQFLDNLPVEGILGLAGPVDWAAKWTDIGNAHCLQGDLDSKVRAFDKAAESWLCALTAFEVAKSVAEEGSPQSGEVSAKVKSAIRTFELSLRHKVQQIRIAFCDETELPAYYLPAAACDPCVPAVICISREEETAAMLLGRLLPIAAGGGMSMLVIAYDDISHLRNGHPEFLLSSSLDYLAAQPGVDAARIGIYGEGLAAALATDVAVSDPRVAAAVCDGGLWNWTRLQASIGWMTRAAGAADENAVSAHRSRLFQKLKCPVLVVASCRGIVSVPEAIELRTACTAKRIDLELALAQTTRTAAGEIENFVTSDDAVFGWLRHKLAHSPASSDKHGHAYTAIRPEL